MFDYQERIRQLCASLEKNNLDAFVTSFLPHLRYLTGFTGSHGLCVITQSKVFFLTDFRYKEQIQNEIACSRSYVTRGSLVEKAAEKGLLRNCARTGFEREFLTYSEYQEHQKNFKAIRFVAVADIVESLSSIKDRNEVGSITKAVEITDRVFSKLLAIIKPGISELDVSAEISYLHKSHGAEKDSFEPIVVSGVRGSLPHGRPSSKKIQHREMVTLDLGCFYQGYCSDLTRTIAVGTPSGLAKKIYKIVYDAQQRASDAARNGIAAKKVDGVARGYIRSKGYGGYFGHGLGHGIGLQIHEYPRVSAQSTHTLRTGNVITIEPGIYVPKELGVRIEDDVVIQDGGCNVLTKSPKELIIV